MVAREREKLDVPGEMMLKLKPEELLGVREGR